MTQLDEAGHLPVGPHRLEYRRFGPAPSDAPTIVMLHEGLGSAALWGEFPGRLAAATGAGVFCYSRAGYGASSPVSLPRPVGYMHEEALETLPLVLDAIGFRRGILLGHSDGGSIATIYAGGVQDHRVRGVSLIAPHFVVEETGLEAIRRARAEFEAGPLRSKLARWHRDVDGAFQAWSGPWLDPAFRSWDICDSLGYIRVPVQIVQGTADPYGTTRQIEIAAEECYCPVDATVLDGIGHDPWREAPDATLAAVAAFVDRLLTGHGEGGMARAA